MPTPNKSVPKGGELVTPVYQTPTYSKRNYEIKLHCVCSLPTTNLHFGGEGRVNTFYAPSLENRTGTGKKREAISDPLPYRHQFPNPFPPTRPPISRTQGLSAARFHVL